MRYDKENVVCSGDEVVKESTSQLEREAMARSLPDRRPVSDEFEDSANKLGR